MAATPDEQAAADAAAAANLAAQQAQQREARAEADRQASAKWTAAHEGNLAQSGENPGEDYYGNQPLTKARIAAEAEAARSRAEAEWNRTHSDAGTNPYRGDSANKLREDRLAPYQNSEYFQSLNQKYAWQHTSNVSTAGILVDGAYIAGVNKGMKFTTTAQDIEVMQAKIAAQNAALTTKTNLPEGFNGENPIVVPANLSRGLFTDLLQGIFGKAINNYLSLGNYTTGRTDTIVDYNQGTSRSEGNLYGTDATAYTVIDAVYLGRGDKPLYDLTPGTASYRFSRDEFGKVLRGGNFTPAESAEGLPVNPKMGMGDYRYVGEYQYSTGEVVSRYYEANVGSFIDISEAGAAGHHENIVRSGGGPGSYYQTHLPVYAQSTASTGTNGAINLADYEKLSTGIVSVLSGIPILGSALFAPAARAGRTMYLEGEINRQVSAMNTQTDAMQKAGLVVAGSTGMQFKGTEEQFNRLIAEPYAKIQGMTAERANLVAQKDIIGSTDEYLKGFTKNWNTDATYDEWIRGGASDTIDMFGVNSEGKLLGMQVMQPGMDVFGRPMPKQDTGTFGFVPTKEKPSPVNLIPGLDEASKMSFGYIKGTAQGWKEKPLEAAAWFAVGFVLPPVVSGASKILSGSRLTGVAKSLEFGKEGGVIYKLADYAGIADRLPNIKVGQMLFGSVPTRAVPRITEDEIAQVMKVSNLNYESAAAIVYKTNTQWLAGGRYLNLPLTTAEIGLGAWYAQSVVERVTTRPTMDKSGNEISYTSEKEGEHTRIYNADGSYNEKWTNSTNTRTAGMTTEKVSGSPAINFRGGSVFGMVVGDEGLRSNIHPELFPSLEEMAKTFGEISAVEIIPAATGAIFGQWAWPRLYGLSRTAGLTQVNLAPDELPITHPGYVKGGTGFETQYPVGHTNAEDLLRSFKEGTFIPEPVEMVGAGRVKSEVPYTPTHTFLPNELPNVNRVWTAWEADPMGGVGSTFSVKPGSSELTGMATGSGIYGYFTKVASGQREFDLFGVGLPTVSKPLIVRTSGAENFIVVPEEIRRGGYSTIQSWMRMQEGNNVYLQMMKGEYEGLIPDITEFNKQTVLRVTGKNYYVNLEGVRVPIKEVTFDTKRLLQSGDIGYVPESMVKSIQAGARGATTPDALLSRLNPVDRTAMENLLKVTAQIEQLPLIEAKGLDVSLVKSIGKQYASDVENLLRQHNAVVYGSAGRTAYMSEKRIFETYEKLPGDLDIRTDDPWGLAKGFEKIWGKDAVIKPMMSNVNPNELFGITVSRKMGGKLVEVADIHPTHATMQENPFGWKPSKLVTKNGIIFEDYSQQILRTGYGSMAGREYKGEWSFGPKPHRIEKDTLGFFGDVQWELEGQINKKAANVIDIRDQMRELRKHPMVSKALGGKVYRYGKEADEFFATTNLSYYGKRTAAVNLTSMGIGAGAGKGILVISSIMKNISPLYSPAAVRNILSNSGSLSKSYNQKISYGEKSYGAKYYEEQYPGGKSYGNLYYGDLYYGGGSSGGVKQYQYPYGGSSTGGRTYTYHYQNYNYSHGNTLGGDDYARLLLGLTTQKRRRPRKKRKQKANEWYIWNPVPTMETVFGTQLNIQTVLPKAESSMPKMQQVKMPKYKMPKMKF